MRGLLPIIWRTSLKEMELIEPCLFIGLVALIYVDDLVFGVTSINLVLSFAEEMETEFEMSTVYHLTFFLGL